MKKIFTAIVIFSNVFAASVTAVTVDKEPEYSSFDTPLSDEVSPRADWMERLIETLSDDGTIYEKRKSNPSNQRRKRHRKSAPLEEACSAKRHKPNEPER